eukprot:6478462-Amphidinium_carterae.1
MMRPPTEKMQRLIRNFAFVYCMPRELAISAELQENSDNEDLEDTVVTFNEDELKQAMKTHVRGGGEAESLWHADAEEKKETTRQYEKTIEMFELSNKIWMHEQRIAKDETMAGSVQGLLRIDVVTDANAAKAAAVESRRRSTATVL